MSSQFVIFWSFSGVLQKVDEEREMTLLATCLCQVPTAKGYFAISGIWEWWLNDISTFF